MCVPPNVAKEAATTHLWHIFHYQCVLDMNSSSCSPCEWVLPSSEVDESSVLNRSFVYINQASLARRVHQHPHLLNFSSSSSFTTTFTSPRTQPHPQQTPTSQCALPSSPPRTAVRSSLSTRRCGRGQTVITSSAPSRLRTAVKHGLRVSSPSVRCKS
jgi:hypothetical protein